MDYIYKVEFYMHSKTVIYTWMISNIDPLSMEVPYFPRTVQMAAHCQIAIRYMKCFMEELDPGNYSMNLESGGM